jgi:hypothetical protein
MLLSERRYFIEIERWDMLIIEHSGAVTGPMMAGGK